MVITPAGHRTIGIRHVLKRLKRRGLIDSDILYPDDAARDIEDRLITKARQWYRLGALRGAVVALDAILQGRIGVEQRPKGRTLVGNTSKLLWPKRTIRVSIGKRKVKVQLPDFDVDMVKDLGFTD
jgi:hypothetical protein